MNRWLFFASASSFFSLAACGGTTSPDGGAPDPDAGGLGTTSCTHEGTEYSLGDLFPSADGCNTCSCTQGGIACTEKACAEAKACGARAGDTCSPSEFCSYEAGQYCGAADAQASCQPRPDACDASYVPVCGCDHKTYANACSANSAGQGVLQAGECPKE